MENEILSWKAKEYDFRPKTITWYWTVGIVAVGLSVASIIVGNYLFAAVAILGGFTIMLVGSRRPIHQTYTLTEKGFRIGDQTISFSSIKSFSLFEDEPRSLTLITSGIPGVATIPLVDTDYRRVRTELKNKNIEEVEATRSIVDHLSEKIGL